MLEKILNSMGLYTKKQYTTMKNRASELWYALSRAYGCMTVRGSEIKAAAKKTPIEGVMRIDIINCADELIKRSEEIETVMFREGIDP